MISRRAFLGRGSAIAVGAWGAALAGCAVGRPYVAPQPELPARFPAQDAVASSGAVALAAWWHGLGDASLTACVEAALKNNADLRMAAARIEQARAGIDAVRALSLPIGQVSGVGGRGEDSASSPVGSLLEGFRLNRETDLYASVLTVGWEADLFGQIRQAREARTAQVELEVEKARAMRVAVAAETARAYVLLRALQGRSAVLDARTALAERALKLTERRAAVGEGARVEVNAARAELAALGAARPSLAAGLVKAADALDVLQGAPLGQSHALLAETGGLPTALPAAVLDAPAAAVARRPDVAAAEGAVAASHAGVRVAMAGYYPSVSLGGLVGFSSTDAARLFDPDAKLWLGGASVRWRLLDWGRLNADLRAAKGREAEALAVYRATTEKAAAEIDTALAAVRAGAERTQQVEAVIGEIAKVRHAADRAHAVGELALDPVLRADQRLWEARDQGIVARSAALEASIDLYRALGAA
ncbi:efflux transporter outer membrane subunit [Caulobacter sp.]|uniref:efflux transporter outer membrane subunit n=1 Tax=Caulobacter sp. TaxID=78 RepID=UPI003BAC4136